MSPRTIMVKQRVALCLCGSIVLFTSCHKGDTPQPATPTQLLTGKKWQLQTSIITAPNQPTIDLYALTPSYTKDDFEQFDSPNIFTYNEGPTKYSPASPQTQSGTWVLSLDNTQLTIVYGGRTVNYVVDDLTSTSLKAHINQAQTNGTTSVLTNTFVVLP